jgi:ketosteroid isomerase-like protein
MSEENVEILRRVAEIWNESGWKGAVDEGLLHPEIEYHDDKRWPEARSAFGTSALIKRFDEVLEVLGQGHVEVEKLLDAGGDQVVVIFRFSGEARASGIPHDYRWGYLCRVRDGQVDYLQAYLDPEAALEAAGLSE